MKTLDRYIFREILTSFAVALAAFTGILLTLRIIKLAALVINKGVSPLQVITVFAAIIPTFFEYALPMSALLGVMLALARLSGDSEIIVLRASGVSILRLVAPVAAFGALVCAGGLYVSHVLRPWGFLELSRTLFAIARSQSTIGLEPGIFNHIGAMTVYSTSVSPADGRLERVVIDDQRAPTDRKVIFAAHGLVVPNEAARTITFKLRSGVMHEFDAQGDYLVTDFADNDIVLDAEDMFEGGSNRERASRELSTPELMAAVSAGSTSLEKLKEEIAAGATTATAPDPVTGNPLDRSALKKRLRKLGLEEHRRSSLPGAALLLALMGLPLGIQPPRTQRAWGLGFSIVVGLGVFVGYFSLLSTGAALAESGRLNPFLAVWLPNVMTLAVAAAAIRAVGSERWQSIAHVFESLVGPLRFLVRRRA